MPHKFATTHWHMPKEADRRRKLTDEEKENIKYLHKQGESIHSIAKQYAKKCSRRLIQFVIFPERNAKLKANAKKNKSWLKYAERGAVWAKTMRRHRAYKQSLFLKQKP